MKEVFSAEAIQSRVRELAADIDKVYLGESVVAVCVLKGAFPFFSDLVRNMKTDTLIDFVRLASYGDGTSSSTHVQITKDVEVSLEGRHVLIVEDIVDSGRSMDFLLRYFSSRGARSLRIAALIDKKERREIPVHTDFVGFDLSSGFIVGYGLDHAERYRTLPAIYELLDC
jgi:hypoxanthine phosphoribosyltransferase